MTKKKSAKKRLAIARKKIKILEKAGFGRRVIREAMAKPRGLIGLTLTYGYKKAKAIRLEISKRKRLISIRKRRRR